MKSSISVDGINCYNPTVGESAGRRSLWFRIVTGRQAVALPAPESSPLPKSAAAHPDLFALLVLGAGFGWRAWMAHATFFNTDEAWHYSVANQNSLLAVYKASHTLAHPPLMVFVLYFSKHLGNSDLMIRMPGVVASTVFCWIFYKWMNGLFGRAVAMCGLVFAALLPPMIALSSEVRQYGWMLMFAIASAYFLERSLSGNSAHLMLLSLLSLWLAMLSHYSAFLFAAGLGIYTILRMVRERPSGFLISTWALGQLVGVALAAVLYKTHIAKLGAVYPVAHPLQRFGDFYIGDWYFHPGRDHLLYFLYRGTLGVFRFVFGHTGVGQVAAVLFFAGVVWLVFARSGSAKPHRSARAALLIVPFALNWIAVAAGLFPYGRTRQCVYLALFGFVGVAITLTRMCRGRSFPAGILAVGMVGICQHFGTLQGRDMLPLSEQRHEHMDHALEFLNGHISPQDIILTDRATEFQLEHYLCRNEQMKVGPAVQGFAAFECGGLHVVATGPNDGALSAENVVTKWAEVKHVYGLRSTAIWVVQGGWASGLGETLRSRLAEYSTLEVHSFGRYLEVFQVPRS